MDGQLYVVATPIGNLADSSQRMVDTLRAVDLILAEDTRHSRHLLDHFAITTPLRSYHEHSGRRAIDHVLGLLGGGQAVALISDAGTPLISDPGYRLVAAARAAGHRVSAIPGPCAAITALAAAGLATDRFLFAGFLPSKRQARQRRLEELTAQDCTVVFYEAPHRVTALIADLNVICGPSRPARLAKELTKVHEAVIGDTLGDLAAWLAGAAERRRGEFVVLLEGRTAESDEAQLVATLKILLAHLSPAKAVQIAQQLTGARRNRLYELAQDLVSRG